MVGVALGSFIFYGKFTHYDIALTFLKWRKMWIWYVFCSQYTFGTFGTARHNQNTPRIQYKGV